MSEQICLGFSTLQLSLLNGNAICVQIELPKNLLVSQRAIFHVFVLEEGHSEERS